MGIFLVFNGPCTYTIPHFGFSLYVGDTKYESVLRFSDSVFLTPMPLQAQKGGNDSPSVPMAHIPSGIYIMGSQKSLIELDPADLLNTDRHALGPEDPAHEVHIDGYY